MAQDFAKRFYNSKNWKQCRDSFISYRESIDGGLCQECKERLGYIVHHKVMLTESNIDNPNISLNWKNLEWVCKDCHDNFPNHGVGKSLTPKIEFDAEGNPIAPIEK